MSTLTSLFQASGNHIYLLLSYNVVLFFHCSDLEYFSKQTFGLRIKSMQRFKKLF